MDLKLCYELGKALRYGDSEEFLAVYDTFLKLEQRVSAEKLDRIKELARQISELEVENFILIQSTVATRTSASLPSDTQPLPALLRSLYAESVSMAASVGPTSTVASNSEPRAPIEGALRVPVGATTEPLSAMNSMVHNSNSLEAAATGGQSDTKSDDTRESVKSNLTQRRDFKQNSRSLSPEKLTSFNRPTKPFNHLEVVRFLWKGWLRAQRT